MTNSPEDGSYEALVYWFQFSTFYTNATIQFDSWDDLGAKQRSADYKPYSVNGNKRTREQENVIQKNETRL